MSMTYVFAKRIIENRTFGNKDEFILKLDVFLMGSRITQSEYEELIGMLNEK
mgnify:CR=1 FL=1